MKYVNSINIQEIMVNGFITNRYEDIMLMSKKICRSSPEFEEVGHFSIEKFMIHERAEELIEAGKGMQFLSGIIHRSFHSSTSQYHTLIRQKGRVHGFTSNTQLEEPDVEYNDEQDNVVAAIQIIIEEMVNDSKEMWFRSVLLQMFADNPNYSKIARETGVPRTSISRAVKEAKEHIKEELIKRGINYGL